MATYELKWLHGQNASTFDQESYSVNIECEDDTFAEDSSGCILNQLHGKTWTNKKRVKGTVTWAIASCSPAATVEHTFYIKKDGVLILGTTPPSRTDRTFTFSFGYGGITKDTSPTYFEELAKLDQHSTAQYIPDELQMRFTKP